MRRGGVEVAGKTAGESEFAGKGGMYTPTDRQADPVTADREKMWQIHTSDSTDAGSGPTDVQSA